MFSGKMKMIKVPRQSCTSSCTSTCDCMKLLFTHIYAPNQTFFRKSNKFTISNEYEFEIFIINKAVEEKKNYSCQHNE